MIVNNDGVPLKSTLSAEQTTQYSSLFSQVRTETGKPISGGAVWCITMCVCARVCVSV